VFTVATTDSAVALNAVKIGGTAINADNYTFANGKLTIKSTYLATLTNGVKTITIAMTGGVDMTVTITVGV